MQILIAFSHEKGGKIVLENAVENILAAFPTMQELISVKRRLREAGYQNVVILNWMVVKD